MGITMWRQGDVAALLFLLPFIAVGLLLIAICVWAAFASLGNESRQAGSRTF